MRVCLFALLVAIVVGLFGPPPAEASKAFANPIFSHCRVPGKVGAFVLEVKNIPIGDAIPGRFGFTTYANPQLIDLGLVGAYQGRRYALQLPKGVLATIVSPYYRLADVWRPARTDFQIDALDSPECLDGQGVAFSAGTEHMLHTSQEPQPGCDMFLPITAQTAQIQLSDWTTLYWAPEDYAATEHMLRPGTSVWVMQYAEGWIQIIWVCDLLWVQVL